MHTIAWRKVKDFHYAEEIVQDVFLEAYEKLPTLKDPRRFAGWLYVITSRCCVNWLRKNTSKTQSLEYTHGREIAKLSYEHYLSEQRDAETVERNKAIVNAMLNKLPESEQTVLNLYYFSGMTAKEIGELLGVSANTITSRLQRARKRLEKQEELLISEILGSFQLPSNLTENIMRQVADMKPTPTPTGKPLTPWVAFGTATLLIVLMLGASNQYLARFQQSYSFEAQSERTIEIIDAPITLDIDSKPAVRNQTGSVAIPSENSGGSLQDSQNALAPNTQKNPFSPAISQWNQVSGPQGSHVSEMFVTSDGVLYAATASGIYNRTAGAAAWTLVNTRVPTGNFPMPMAEYNNTLYIVSKDEVFASTDKGETWNTLGARPEGDAIGLIITDAAYSSDSQPGPVMYLALEDKGIFCSMNAGKQWRPLNDGLAGKSIYAIAGVGKTLFVGTSGGLYRLNSDVWKQVLADASSAVHSLAVMETNLYVATGPDPFVFGKRKQSVHRIRRETAIPWKIFHTTDLGTSWTEITPKDKSAVMVGPRNVNILTAGKTLLALDGGLSFRSNDDGQTWAKLGFDGNPIKQNVFTTTADDENTLYIAGVLGVHRTIDGGDSWHPFMEGIVGTRIRSLTAFKNKLYAHSGNNIVQSTDDGKSWKRVSIDANVDTLESIGQEDLRVDFSFRAKLTLVNGELYGIAPDGNNLRIFRLSTDDNTLIPTQRIPAFDGKMLSTELWTTVAKAEQLELPDDIEKNAKLMEALRGIATFVIAGGFAISDETFYIEHQRRLFKWKPDDSEWTNTGLIDLGKQPDADLQNGFKLAASGETVYVGKREGELFQSLDAGDTWKDITSTLPLRFTRFNEIAFAGSTVYVATDNGVLSSQDAENWGVLTDTAGQSVVIDRLAINHTNVYGAGDTGVYRLDDRGRWKQISPSVPGKVISVVVNNDRLYIATQHRGMFHIPLEEESLNANLLTQIPAP